MEKIIKISWNVFALIIIIVIVLISFEIIYNSQEREMKKLEILQMEKRQQIDDGFCKKLTEKLGFSVDE
jgi:uncharacterized membrane protein YvbJ